jgi:hypothetical protein
VGCELASRLQAEATSGRLRQLRCPPLYGRQDSVIRSSAANFATATARAARQDTGQGKHSLHPFTPLLNNRWLIAMLCRCVVLQQAVQAVDGVDLLLLEVLPIMDDLTCLLSTLIELSSDLPVTISLVYDDGELNSRDLSLYSIVAYILGQQSILCTQISEHSRSAVPEYKHAQFNPCDFDPIPGIVAIAVNCSSRTIGDHAMQEGRRACLDHCRSSPHLPLLSQASVLGVWSPVPLLVCFFTPEQVGRCAASSDKAELHRTVVQWYMSGARGIGGCCADVIHQIRDVLLSREGEEGEWQDSALQASAHRTSLL